MSNPDAIALPGEAISSENRWTRFVARFEDRFSIRVDLIPALLKRERLHLFRMVTFGGFENFIIELSGLYICQSLFHPMTLRAIF
jgi:hypothetical protein